MEVEGADWPRADCAPSDATASVRTALPSPRVFTTGAGGPGTHRGPSLGACVQCGASGEAEATPTEEVLCSPDEWGPGSASFFDSIILLPPHPCLFAVFLLCCWSDISIHFEFFPKVLTSLPGLSWFDQRCPYTSCASSRCGVKEAVLGFQMCRGSAPFPGSLHGTVCGCAPRTG